MTTTPRNTTGTASRKNPRSRIASFCQSVRNEGRRYDGISRMISGRKSRLVRRSTVPSTNQTITRIPYTSSTYCTPCGPRSAKIIAWSAAHGTPTEMSVAAMNRSLRVSSTRVARMPGTLQPKASRIGITAYPWRPRRCITRSSSRANLGRYPTSSIRPSTK